MDHFTESNFRFRCYRTPNYPFVGDVIDHLGIGRAAFYRYFPPDRIRELRKQP
jgi:hypothetical protein